MRPFSKCPSWWTADNRLAQLIGGQSAGTSIATIRLALALVTLTTRHDAFFVEIGSKALARHIGVSLPTLRAAIRSAEAIGWIRFNRGGGRLKSRFELVFPEHEAGMAGHYFIVPNDVVSKRMPALPKRGDIPLAAIKIYALLLTARSNASRESLIGYDKMRERTGIQRDHIRDALSLLALHGLIGIDKEPVEDGPGSRNSYSLRGAFWRTHRLPGAAEEADGKREYP